MNPRILLVEDHKDLAFGLQRNLEFEGYSVTVARDGESARRLASSDPVDLVILDLMLPDVDGMAVLEHLRGVGIDVPVLVLTAKTAEIDKVRALRGGADDYLTKPFGVLELVARVEALLRRTSSAPREREVYRFGEVRVDPAARCVSRAGEDVSLTPREFELLVALLRAKGEARSRDALLRDVWGHRASVASRTVDTHVAELRRKLEPEASAPAHLRTVRKFGYRLDGVVTDNEST